jgi:hypothetical protein
MAISQRRTLFLAGALVALAGAGPTTAQEAPPPRFELTPYAGYRFGGEFAAETGDAEYEIHEGDAQGLIFNIKARESGTQWEILYGRQQTEVETQASFVGGPLLPIDIDYVHFGGTYLFDRGTTRPFVALTVGLTRFEPSLSDPEPENFFSGSLGGGVHLRATQRVGVRLEARVFATFVDTDGAIFCVSGVAQISGCAISIHGEAILQYEVHAGVVFRF